MKNILYEEQIREIGRLAVKNYIIRNHRFFMQEESLLKKEVDGFLQEDVWKTYVENQPMILKDHYAKKLHNKLQSFLKWSAEKTKKEEFFPLEYVFSVFSLDVFERFCILMAILPEWEEQFSMSYQYVGNDWKKSGLTVQLAIESFLNSDLKAADFRSYFLDNSKLMTCFFEKTEDNKNQTAFEQTLKLNQRILSFLFQGERQCRKIEEYGSLYFPKGLQEKKIIGEKKYEKVIHCIKETETLNINWLFCFCGSKGSGRHLHIKAVAHEMQKSILFLDMTALLKQENVEENISRIKLELQLQQAILCLHVDKVEEETKGDKIKDVWKKLELEKQKIVFLICREWEVPLVETDNLYIHLELFSVLEREEREALWLYFAENYRVDEKVLKKLAGKFHFTPAQIKQVLKCAEERCYAQEQESITETMLYESSYQQLQHKLENKAAKVQIVYEWEDLILPEKKKEMLLDACNQVEYKSKVYTEWGFQEKMAYGRGISMIFAGSPGTGKTMAAQVMAGCLHMELYKVELAGIVSKYIGETEKNLKEIFDEAKKSHGILFFDEADVLFSKRTEVKDANDKYNNMEAAFLLQKIEEYSGVVILASNFLQNIDEAFKRRISFIIEFPFPDEEHRIQLWKSVFPKKMPLKEDVDIDFLGRKFELSGSNIKNIALKAAFYAAAEEKSVGMKEIIKGVKEELAKSGKQLTQEELGAYHMLF
ncbi:MAG: AAA family ATPase [Acetivibrio sp.]